MTAYPGLVVVCYPVAALNRVVHNESVSLGANVSAATEVGLAIVGIQTAAGIISVSAMKANAAEDFGICIIRCTSATCVVRAFAFNAIAAAYVHVVVVRRIDATRVIIQAFAFHNKTSLTADG